MGFRRILVVVAALLPVLVGPSADAGIVATGNLHSPDAMDVVLSFGLTVDSRVSVRTMSYAGGSVQYFEADPSRPWQNKKIVKKVFPRGGFDPITAIRHGSSYILTNDDGIYAKPDAVTGASFDSQIDGDLKAGQQYEVVVSQYDNFPPNFNGSWIQDQLNGNENRFEDVTGDTRNSSYGVVRVTLNDLVSNAITIDEGSLSGNSKTMLARYSVPIPALGSNLDSGVGYTIGEAASFGYFDHFNWYQTIDSLTGEFDRSTGVDPLYGGNTRFIDPADSYPWYWDEVDASNLLVDRTGHLVTANTQADLFLNFEDSPNFNVPGYSAEFTTYLAGVKSDANVGTVFGAGFSNTAFKWRYTQTEEKSGLVTIRNIDPALSGGGRVEFLGFLTEEDWTAERINNLNASGITVAAQLPAVAAVPEPATFGSMVLILALSLTRFLPHFRSRRKVDHDGSRPVDYYAANFTLDSSPSAS